MMHSPVSDFPPISEQNVHHFFFPQFFLFPIFFSHSPQISNFPLFPCFNLFPPISRNFSFPLLLQIFPPNFGTFTCISFPLLLMSYVLLMSYFYHDAFMHHTMHILDAPASSPLSGSPG